MFIWIPLITALFIGFSFGYYARYIIVKEMAIDIEILKIRFENMINNCNTNFETLDESLLKVISRMNEIGNK